MKTLIAALGGNALIKPGNDGTSKEMLENLHFFIKQIAEVIDGS